MKYNAKKAWKAVPDKDRAAKAEEIADEGEDNLVAPWEKTPGTEYQAAEACETTPFFVTRIKPQK